MVGTTSQSKCAPTTLCFLLLPDHLREREFLAQKSSIFQFTFQADFSFHSLYLETAEDRKYQTPARVDGRTFMPNTEDRLASHPIRLQEHDSPQPTVGQNHRMGRYSQTEGHRGGRRVYREAGSKRQNTASTAQMPYLTEGYFNKVQLKKSLDRSSGSR